MNYETRVILASKEQGITDLVSVMLDKGITAEIAQTGGFTMCAYVELKGGFYIYASPYGASVYDSESFEKDLAVFDEPQTPEIIAGVVWLYLQDHK